MLRICLKKAKEDTPGYTWVFLIVLRLSLVKEDLCSAGITNSLKRRWDLQDFQNASKARFTVRDRKESNDAGQVSKEIRKN